MSSRRGGLRGAGSHPGAGRRLSTARPAAGRHALRRHGSVALGRHWSLAIGVAGASDMTVGVHRRPGARSAWRGPWLDWTGGQACPRRDTLLRAVQADDESLQWRLATVFRFWPCSLDTHPSVVVLVKQANQLTSS